MYLIVVVAQILFRIHDESQEVDPRTEDKLLQIDTVLLSGSGWRRGPSSMVHIENEVGV
jgi:hypothetical protein